MILFTPTRLTKAMHSYYPQLEKIADDLVPALGQQRAAAFLTAADAYNDAELNRLIEAAIQKYLQEPNIVYGLERYCKKFGIEENFSSMTTEKMILCIDHHREKISQALKKEGII